MADLNAKLNVANELFNNQKFEEAAKEFGELIPLVPEKYKEQLLLQKAISLYNGKILEQAITAFEEAVNVNDQTIKLQAMAGKARCLQQLGRTEDALKVFEEVLRLDPSGKHVSWVELARICNSSGNFEKGLEVAAEGLIHQPDDYQNLHTARIVAFFRLEKPLEAIKDVESVLEKVEVGDLQSAERQIYSEVFLQRGQYLMNEGDLENAGTCFDKALDLNASSQVFFLVGVLEMKKNNDAGAIKEIEKALSVDPSFWRARITLGMLFMRPDNQDYEKAIEQFQRAMKISEEAISSNVHFNLGYGLFMLKQMEGAKESLHYVYENEVSNWTNHALLGSIYIEEEGWENAVKFLTAAIDHSNGKADATIHYNLAYAHMKLSQYRNAEKEFRVAAKMNPENKDATVLANQMEYSAKVEEQEQEEQRKLEIERLAREQEAKRMADEAEQAMIKAREERDEHIRLEKEKNAMIDKERAEKAARDQETATRKVFDQKKRVAHLRQKRQEELRVIAGPPQKYRPRRPSLEAIPVGNTSKNAGKYMNWFNENIVQKN